MKILKLLNKKNLSIIIISLLPTFSTIAEDKPVDIWNIDKKEVETSAKEKISVIREKVGIYVLYDESGETESENVFSWDIGKYLVED